MSVFDNQPDEDIQENDYSFFKGEEKDFLNEMRIDKQDMQIDEGPSFKEFSGHEEEEEDQEIPLKTRAAKSTAKLLTATIDAPASALLAFLAKEKDSSIFACTPEEKNTLNEALTEYLKLKGTDIPPGMMLFIVILTIFGGKTINAFKIRSSNIRAENAEKSLNESEKHIDQLKKELDEYRTGKK